MRLGKLSVEVVPDCTFRLDGGAMFGVVPRVLWQKVKPPDERSRIAMAANCLLVESAGELLLIEAGIGDKNDERFRDIFGMPEGGPRLPDRLAEMGYELGDVNHVLLSHLHFDHCGWSTRLVDGRLVPTFPKATYWINRFELRYAREPSLIDRASYLGDNWEPLFEAGVVELFDDEAEPVPGVVTALAPGHNANLSIVLLDGGEGEKGVFWTDLIPTTAHVAYPWIMGFDLYPLDTLESKRRWIPKAAAEGWTCFFGHETDLPCGRLVESRPGRFEARPLERTAA